MTRAVLALVLLAAACKGNRDEECGKSAKCRRRTEAELNLQMLEKAARAQVAEQAAFPIGTVGPTPSKGCCGSSRSDHKCEPDTEIWNHAMWDALRFVVDEPHHYQYAYESNDGQTFTARAIGDLDCDGVLGEYVLRGKIENGVPAFELTPPLRE